MNILITAIPIVMIALFLLLIISVIIQLILVLRKKVIGDYTKISFPLVALFSADTIFVLFSVALANNMLSPQSGDLFVAGSGLGEMFLLLVYYLFFIIYIPVRIILSSLVARTVLKGVKKVLFRALLIDFTIILLIATIFLGYNIRTNITAYQDTKKVETRIIEIDKGRYNSIDALLVDFQKGFPDFNKIIPLINPFWYSNGTANVDVGLMTAQNDAPFYRFNNPDQKSNEKIENELIYADGGTLEEGNPYFKTVNGSALLHENIEKTNIDQRKIIRVFAVTTTNDKLAGGNIEKKYLKNVFDLILDHNPKGWLIEVIEEPFGGLYLKYNYKNLDDLEVLYADRKASDYINLDYQDITWNENYKEK